MGEHSPGPWSIRFHTKLDPSWVDRPRNIMGADDKIVATFTDTAGQSWRSGGEKAANARLIAAAPKLLETLQSVEWSALVDDEHGGMEDGCPWCDQAQRHGHDQECGLADALAQATGAQPAQPPEHP